MVGWWSAWLKTYLRSCQQQQSWLFSSSSRLCPFTAGFSPHQCLPLSSVCCFPNPGGSPPSLLCRLAIFCLVVLLISSLSLVATLCSVWPTWLCYYGVKKQKSCKHCFTSQLISGSGSCIGQPELISRTYKKTVFVLAKISPTGHRTAGHCCESMNPKPQDHKDYTWKLQTNKQTNNNNNNNNNNKRNKETKTVIGKRRWWSTCNGKLK